LHACEAGLGVGRKMAEAYPPRERHPVQPLMRLSGLEPLNYNPNLANMRSTFLNIGERCNVAGSMLYKKAIVDGDYDKAFAIAVKQVRPIIALELPSTGSCLYAI
jgi:5-methyltetrahydrofolate--homocysteine methyltransferase